MFPRLLGRVPLQLHLLRDRDRNHLPVDLLTLPGVLLVRLRIAVGIPESVAVSLHVIPEVGVAGELLFADFAVVAEVVPRELVHVAKSDVSLEVQKALGLVTPGNGRK